MRFLVRGFPGLMDIHSADYAALVRNGPSFVDFLGSWISTHFLNPLNLWSIECP